MYTSCLAPLKKGIVGQSNGANCVSNQATAEYIDSDQTQLVQCPVGLRDLFIATTSKTRLFTLINIWCEVVLDITGVLDGVLNDDGNVGAHAKDDGGSEAGGLGEEVEIAKGEGELDGLLHVDDDLFLLLLGGGVLTDEDVAGAKVTGDREADALLGAGVAKDLEVADDALELSGGHLDGALVLGVGDAKLLGVNVHELELCKNEFGGRGEVMVRCD